MLEKKELASLVRKIEAMQASLIILQRELAEIANRLKFLPVSQSSSDDEDEEDLSSSITSRMGK